MFVFYAFMPINKTGSLKMNYNKFFESNQSKKAENCSCINWFLLTFFFTLYLNYLLQKDEFKEFKIFYYTNLLHKAKKKKQKMCIKA